MAYDTDAAGGKNPQPTKSIAHRLGRSPRRNSEGPRLGGLRLKTLILGLGNPILSDDSVGLRVAQALNGRFAPERVTVMESNLSGLSLIDLLLGYHKVIIVDSIQAKEGNAGEIYRIDAGEFATNRCAISHHDVNLGTVLEMGKRLSLEIPQEIGIFAIEAADVITFGESCSPDVEQAIPKAIEAVTRELECESLA